MNSESRPDREVLAELLLQWEELYECGRDTTADELARDHPHLAPELARRIKALKTVSWITKPTNPVSHELTQNPVGLSGRTFGGRYRLDALIAEGGFAEVYRAFDSELQRTVAVKIPKRSQLHSTESFLAEARRVARLKHDGIVPVYDVGVENDTCFIVSEFLEGGSLADRLVGDKPSKEEAIRWICEVADALQHAHEQEIVHRDLKPANILIDQHGRAKLADFGIAQSSVRMEDLAPSIGTLSYMSAEQVRGNPADHRSDIYSLGVVLYESLTGRLPYSSPEPSVIRREIMDGRIGFPEPVPTPIKKVIRKATAHSPHLRYESAKDLALDLSKTKERQSGLLSHLGLATAVLVLGGIAFLPSLRPKPVVVEQKKEVAPSDDVRPLGSIALSGFGDKTFLEGTLPDAWLKKGVFAEINSPGIARFPRVQESAYLLKVDLIFHSPRGRVSVQIGEPNCNVDVSMGDLWAQDLKQDKVAVRFFRGQPFGINWSGETHFEVNQRMTISAVVVDDLWVLLQNGKEVLRNVGDPTDFCPRIVVDGDPNVTIYSISCRSLTPDDVQRLRIPQPLRQLSCNSESTRKRLEGQYDNTWLRHPEPERDFVLGNYLAMKWIAPGEFTMGDPEAPHVQKGSGKERVRFASGYWIGIYEITQGQWKELMGDNPSRVTGSPYLPVNYISWSDAQRFCRVLNERERKADRLPDGYEYRLPTEAEWENASRAGTTQKFVVPLKELAYRGNKYPNLVEVGTTPANSWGLHEVLGNVPEWCLDRWHEYTNDENEIVVDRFHEGDPSVHPFVLRGQGFWLTEETPSVFTRLSRHDIAGGFRGFRVVLGSEIKTFSKDSGAEKIDDPFSATHPASSRGLSTKTKSETLVF